MRTNPFAKTASVCIVVLLLSLTVSRAQSIVGFWEFELVKVGTETMTPVAKWTKINTDNTYQVGNGWVQNGEGTWTYDKQKRLYQPKEKNGITDEAGPFKVSFKGDKMIWEREEEGMPVVVTLRKTTQMPMSTSDQLKGLWDLTKATLNGTDIISQLDPENKHYLFVRWDRVYMERTPQGERAYGYWHIDGHKPELTLISHTEGKTMERWRVDVNHTILTLVGISEGNKDRELVYQRINVFPE
jgi:hypothetical protein